MSESLKNPIIVGDRLYLRPLEPDDRDLVRQWLFEDDYAAQTCRPLSLEPAPAPVVPPWSQADLVIAERASGAVMGKVRYFDWNPRNQAVEIGYSVDPARRRRGLGSEGVRLLLKWLFGSLGVNKIHAQTGSFNSGSIALLEKLGFKRDGVLREHHYFQGRLHDDHIYSLLRSEWQDLSA